MRKRWTRPLLKVEVRSKVGSKDWDIKTTTFGKEHGEVSARINRAVRAELFQLLAERKLRQAVADIELPLNARFRPWIGKLLAKFARG